MLRSQPNLPTVRIRHPDVPGGVLINARDFDPEKHERFAGDDRDGLEGCTVAQLRAKCEAAGLDIPAGAKKADLLALLSGDAADADEDE